MHSVGPDNGGSPKKRSLSRGISEDESLRSFIQESENSSRRLTRSDSRAAALRKKSDSQSEQDSIMGLPEMLELQASHDELVQELRGLEVERETLLFQVDVLQDTLEGVEELLAEAQREAGQASVELEQEKQAKMKLEKLVRSLMQEVEGLKKERNTEQSMSSNVRVSEDEENAAKSDVTQLTGMVRQEESGDGRVGKDEGTEGEGSSPTKVRWMVNKPPSHTPSLALGHLCPEDGVHQRPCAHSSEDARDSSPDRSDSDNISNYEDAPGETPELDRVFPGDSNQKEDAVGNVTCSQSVDGREPGNNDSCVLS